MRCNSRGQLHHALRVGLIVRGEDNGVLAEAGIGPIGFGPLAVAIGSPVDYRVAGVSVTPPPSEPYE